MARPNLLRIDDLLLRASGWLAFLWAVGSVTGLALAAEGERGLAGTVALILLAATAPIGLVVAGSKLRRRERRAWALHKLVDDHVELPASDLLRSSDFSPATLDRAIRDLNNAGAAFLVWDRKADVVQDGRLRSARIHVEECGSCGAKVSIALHVGQVSAARCPYCRDPLAAASLMEEKARLIEELDADPAPPSSHTKSSFSVPIFVVLLLLFWPLGVGYALWHWRA